MSNTALNVSPAIGRSAADVYTVQAMWGPLASFGTAGPVAFLAIASVAGALTPGYDPVRQTISEIALGPIGWLQTANFYVFGASIIAFGLALALRFGGQVRVVASACLLALSGLSLIAAGAFPAVVVDGEPTPAALIHGLAFFGTIVPLPGVYALTALRLVEEGSWRRMATYSAGLPSIVVFLLVVFGAFGSDPGAPLVFISGLLQRLLLVVAFGWVSLLGWRLLGRKEAAA